MENKTRFNNYYVDEKNIHLFNDCAKENYSVILEFEVINPQTEFEYKSEILKLSMFGEYCPDKSLRGYSLEELLLKPIYYRPRLIAQRGKIILLNYDNTRNNM